MRKRFCPNCGSDWVEPDTSNRAMTAYGGGDPVNWQCRSCGYTGPMPEGEPPEDAEFEVEESYSREYTGFGPAYAKYVFYVVLPILAFYLLLRTFT